MAQGQVDEVTMAHNLLEPIRDWSFDTINPVSTADHDDEIQKSGLTKRIDDVSSGLSSTFSPSDDTTQSTTPSAAQNEEIESQERIEAVNVQENAGRIETDDQVDKDVTMADADADAGIAIGDSWDPTPEELYAIAFGEDDADLEAVRDYLNRENQHITEGNQEADIQRHEHEEDTNDAEDRQAEDHTQRHGEDVQEGLQGFNDAENRHDEGNPQMPEDEAQEERDRAANTEADTNPQPQNPWGMSDAQLEQLIIDQDRFFGYIRDRDSAPKPFSCVCGESSMDPSGFVNLTCPDNCVRCVDCLNANVRVGLESKKNYPPRCCIPIDFENVFYHLEPSLIDRWLDVRPEFEDVAPVYCSVKECSLYLPRDLFIDDGKWALCIQCDVKTCTVCLCPKPQHDENSNACPERLDKMDKALIKDRGWKACPQCREMIERTEGCDHMICECGQEFCYGCGRSYAPPMPCNCHGQNRWAEEMQAEADPQRQQQILRRIANGDVDGEEDEHEHEDEENEEDGNNEVERHENPDAEPRQVVDG